MGTISDKLTYLNETKQLIKNSINSLGGEITSQTTFRQYATELDSIYASLPKVSGTGSSISLSPTRKGRITSQINGDTLQGGEPTPDTPVEIQSVTGLQNIEINGKNLFDGNYYSTYVTASSPHTYGSTSGARSGIIKVQPNTTYTISKEVSNRFRVSQFQEYPVVNSSVANNYQIVSNEGTTTTYTLTTESTTKYLVIQITNESQENVKMQVELGSTATTYEPYQSQEYKINLGNIHLYEGDQIIGTPDNWSIKHVMAEDILDGSENISFESSASTPSQRSTFRITISNILKTTDYISNRFIKGSSTSNRLVFVVNSSRPYISLEDAITGINTSDSNTEKINKLKTWLSSNNVSVVYELATPTTEPITNTELISQLNALYYANSYNGTTNITITSEDLEMIMTASALKEVE